MNFLAAAGPLSATSHGAAARLSNGFSLRIDLLTDWLARVAVVPDGGLAVDRTWMIAPSGDASWEGRDRLSTEGFERPDLTLSGEAVEGEDWRVTVTPSPLALTVERRNGAEWQTVMADRPTGAYQWFSGKNLLRHFQARSLSDRHYGLGDKTGRLDRTGRRLRCLQTDALGYDAEASDPLYKHAPFVIVDGEAGATGLLYDTLSEITFDLGAEHSNSHARYRHVDVDEKGLVYYFIAGPKVRDVVPRLMRLTGRPAFQPRWSMGFAFTSMHHADAPNAQQVITEFAERCRAEHIPVSAIHLGPGYTTREDGGRYVFTWNRTKFPDRNAFFQHLGELGFRTVANVKPVLLTEHPDYPRASVAGWFVRCEDGKPAVDTFRGGAASSLDFTNPAAVAWWKGGVTAQVLGAGFTAAWNDGNEADLWDETATVHGFGTPLPAIKVRPVHALLMARATHEATLKRAPEKRPYTVTRAGPIGIARYGETWSGGNRTSWHTLKWNLRQGLSMSLSGMPATGHDIGGFDGPKPDPELLVRWVEMMSLHPRAVMNSWKPDLDDPATVPWMHPDTTGLVREALRLRYRFMPLIYQVAWQAHIMGTPIIAPAFYHFDDAECRADADVFMLGPDVLVAPVVTQASRSVEVYLPRTEGGWHEFHGGAVHEGGSVVTVDAPVGQLPVFVRAGAILPLATAWPDEAPHDATDVELRVYPGVEFAESERAVFFDDGDGWGYREKDASLMIATARWDGGGVGLSVRELWSGRGRPRLTGSCSGAAGRSFHMELPDMAEAAVPQPEPGDDAADH